MVHLEKPFACAPWETRQVYSLMAIQTLMAFKVAMIWVASRSNATAREAPAARRAKVLLIFI